MLEPLEKEYGREGLHQLWDTWLDVLEELPNSGGNNLQGKLEWNKNNYCCPTLILHGMKDPIVPNFHPIYLAEHQGHPSRFI